MKSLALPLSLAFCVFTSSTSSFASDCIGPAMWRVAENDAEVILLKVGAGEADFQGSGSPQPAVALEIIYTMLEGEKGYGTLWGPMRSVMFQGPSVGELDDMGFSWQLPTEDEEGHYSVRSDDGQLVLFNLAFDRCL